MRAPFDKLGPAGQPTAVTISVPHAGRAYPGDIGEFARHPVDRLATLEDRHADALVTEAVKGGAAALIARTPRLIIDLNRAETDLDPVLFDFPLHNGHRISEKARGGLGLIPRCTPLLGDLWRRKIGQAELRARIIQHHRPYHQALAESLGAQRAIHGAAVLMDVHSMPPLPSRSGAPPPDIVIGNLWGASARSDVTDLAVWVCEQAGVRVAVNSPYAGNFLIQRHGNPRNQIHALQIEFDRRLYLDLKMREPGHGLPRMRRLVAQLASAFHQHISEIQFPIAAE